MGVLLGMSALLCKRNHARRTSSLPPRTRATNISQLFSESAVYEGARGYYLTIDDANLPAIPKRGQEEQRLIDNILDNLDDLEPRRAYAEWLKERGSALGDYVLRVRKLERMKHDDSVDGATFADYDQGNAELLEEHAEEWFAPLSALHLRPMLWSTFCPFFWTEPVGFIETVDIPRPGILPERAEYFFSAVPLVHELTLDYEWVDFESIAALPQMERIDTLGVLLGTEKDQRALCVSPHLRRLRNLSLVRSPLSEKAGRILGSSRLLPQLERLDLTQCRLGDEGFHAMFGSARPLKLTRLDLAHNDLRVQGINTLGTTPGLRNLQELHLHSNFVSAEGLHTWHRASFMRRLLELNLVSCELDADAAAALATLPFQSLSALHLGANEIGDSGVRALASSEMLAKIERLDLPATAMTTDGLIALAEGSSIGSLRMLDLSQNAIDASGFEELASSSKFQNLSELLANSTDCGDEGLTALANSPHLSNVTKLELDESQITASGVWALVNSKTLIGLTELSLDGNQIGLEGAKALANARNLATLEKLTVDVSGIGEYGAKLLFDRFGEDIVQLRNSGN